jgi:hypothetical protein
MSREYVQILCDVNCEWEGLPPTYRLYVNDELFAERTWVWTNEYLEELIQIQAEPGKYQIRYELVPPHLAQLTVENFRVEHGPARVKPSGSLRIYDES